jgi:hypothetical protein
MLAHSPPFPLIIGYDESFQHVSVEDEEGIILALGQRNRVRCIYLSLNIALLSKLISAIDDEFPALIFLRLATLSRHDTRMALPPTFEAPHLRYFALTHFASPIGHSFLSTAVGLVMLSLDWIHPSTYPHPNDFLQHLSLLPQLEELDMRFRSAVPNSDIEMQLLHTPVITHVTHPNLRVFEFMGVSGFLEAVLAHMAAPLLETFRVQFFNQLSFSVTHLQIFMMSAENLRFSRARIIFHHEAVAMFAFPHVEPEWNNFSFSVPCRHLDWQVSSVTKISKDLNQSFSEVVDLTLDYREHSLSPEWHNQADHTQWRELLGSFRNVKILRVHYGLVGDLSRSLRSDGESSPSLEVLPELKELVCPVRCVGDKTFASPISRPGYRFYSSNGIIDIGPDTDPLP